MYTAGMGARGQSSCRVACVAAAWVLALAPGAGRPAAASPATERTPWLGVAISDGIHGVRVEEVIADTPADGVGLVPGDEIITVAGARVSTFAALQTAISSHRIGQRVELAVWRRGRTLRLTARLGPKLSAGEILYRRLVDRPLPRFDAPVVWGAGSGSAEHLRGRVLVIAFFATTCRECASLHQRLSRLVDQRGRDGLAVLAVSREPRDTLARWARQRSPSFTVLQDVYGELSRRFRINQTPAVVVVNRDGEICYAGIGSGPVVDQAVFAAERALRTGRLYGSR